MSPRSFLAWLVVAAVTLAAAVAVNLSGPEVARVELDNDPVFDALRENPDAITRVEVATAEGAFSLERKPDGGWVAPDASGYAVKDGMVRDLIVGLSDMRLVEAKTSREDRLERLGLRAIDQEGSEAKQIVLLAGDRVVADILVGRSRSAYTGGQEGGTYIRRLSDPQAWLASGKVEVRTALADWLDKDIVNLEAKVIQTAEILPPPEGGEAPKEVRLNREQPGGVFELADLPEGHEPNISEISRVVSGLAYVIFEEVARAEDKPLPDQVWQDRFVTFDGLEVSLEAARLEDGQVWARFSARAVPAAVRDAPGGEQPEEEGADASLASVEERAEALRGKWEGWVYRLPDYAAERLMIPFEELHEPIPEQGS